MKTKVLHAIDSLTPGGGFTICGVYSFNLEADNSKVTCKHCLKKLAPTHKAPDPRQELLPLQ